MYLIESKKGNRVLKENKIPEEIKKIIFISNKIITHIINRLFVNFRFFNLALGKISNSNKVDFSIGTYQTDGQDFFYNPLFIIKQYKSNCNNLYRSCLHIILHCIFRHMFISSTFIRRYWDLACDITVENIICELNKDFLKIPAEKDKLAFIKKITNKIKSLTAERIYYYLIDAKLSESELLAIENLFKSDAHDLWYIKFVPGNEMYDEKIKLKLAKQWKNISENMHVQLEDFEQDNLNLTLSLIQNLKEVNREKYDYTSFLKKFAKPKEVLKISDDEFDYVYYTYGLSLYKNLPLIEPLEYKDSNAIEDFVIAIDTSGSTSGELVQTFINKTFNILKTCESFAHKFNIHIIQCDTEIQKDTKITNQQDLDNCLEDLQIRGLGGTDFRPVFNYVDKLIKRKEFKKLQGLIFFTDGYGDFPAKKTEYPTAFVFIDNNENNYKVPSWAIKLVLQPHDI